MQPSALPHLNQKRGNNSTERAPLPPDTEALIRQHYRFEMDLYDYAKEVHIAQVARVRVLRAGSVQTVRA